MIRSMTVPGPGPNRPCRGRVIPAALAPVEPALSLSAFAPGGDAPLPSVLDAGPALFTTSGRYAIALGLEALGVARGEKVLIPAYHCTTMVEPLERVGAEPVFYRLTEALAPDLDDLATKAGSGARALMATHYFGFPQDVEGLRAFCDARGLALIEDCAHAFFGRFAGRPVGAWGDIAIASPWKFFATGEGGVLIAPRGREAAVALRGQGAGAALRAAYRLVERAVSYQRLPALALLLRMLRRVRGAADVGVAAAEAAAAAAGDNAPPRDYEPARAELTMNVAARAVLGFSSFGRAVAGRRRNYLRLRDALSSLSSGRAVVPDLPDGVAPYMFPMWFDELDRLFPLFEDAALPMQRFGQFLWEGVDETVCPVAAAHSHHAVQFACHQGLTDDELVWMIGEIRRIAG